VEGLGALGFDGALDRESVAADAVVRGVVAAEGGQRVPEAVAVGIGRGVVAVGDRVVGVAVRGDQCGVLVVRGGRDQLAAEV